MLSSSSYIPPIPRVKVLSCNFAEGLSSKFCSTEKPVRTSLISLQLLVHNADHRDVIKIMGAFTLLGEAEEEECLFASPCRWKEVCFDGRDCGSQFTRLFEQKYRCAFLEVYLDWSEMAASEAFCRKTRTALRIMFT